MRHRRREYAYALTGNGIRIGDPFSLRGSIERARINAFPHADHGDRYDEAEMKYSFEW